MSDYQKKWDPVPKYCTHCLSYKPRQGGVNMSQNPLREQWWCSACVTRFRESEQS